MPSRTCSDPGGGHCRRVDDHARIAYDPTNGTISRGDLIVFPHLEGNARDR